MSQPITLTINGNVCHFNVNPNTPLLYILRNDASLKSIKYGCGLEQCGACKVIINGQAVPTCRLPIKDAQDSEIITLEGIGSVDNLHPIQQAFIDKQALQCGFCIPGIIMAVKALLDRNPQPTDADIRAELAVHLCRCGSHNRILNAIRQVINEAAQ